MMEVKVDNLGRFLIPKKWRDVIGIRNGGWAQLKLVGETVIVSKCQNSCTFCPNNESLMWFKDNKVCPECLEEIKRKLVFEEVDPSEVLEENDWT